MFLDVKNLPRCGCRLEQLSFGGKCCSFGKLSSAAVSLINICWTVTDFHQETHLEDTHMFQTKCSAAGLKDHVWWTQGQLVAPWILLGV